MYFHLTPRERTREVFLLAYKNSLTFQNSRLLQRYTQAGGGMGAVSPPPWISKILILDILKPNRAIAITIILISKS